jgi:hypothetical protein
MSVSNGQGENKPGAGRTKEKRSTRPAEKDKGPRKSAATVLVELVTGAGTELFHSPDLVPYATVRTSDGLDTMPLRSGAFRRYLAHRYHASCSRAAGAQALADAVAALEGRALFQGKQLPVYVRLAEDGGRIYLDLADKGRRVVEIGPGGWQLTSEPPVRLRRPRGMLPLPVPERGGTVEALRPFVNLAGDEDWRLLVAWLLQAFRPRGPYPLLSLHGEQGSAKSTTARVLRDLLDPNAAPLRFAPRDGRDLMIGASNAWLLAFDNMSDLADWLSDGLCRLATGGGYATRELYSNDEETIFDAMRPVILTSIEDLATRGDLLERGIILRLPGIAEGGRKSERQLWADFHAARPKILGALLDAVSGALKHLSDVRLEGRPRMADFAEWATAGGRALGWEDGHFSNAYQGNRRDANELALDASPLVSPLWKLVEQGPFCGTASDLLARLTGLVNDAVAKAREWPKRPHVLSGKLRRLAPNLRQAGMRVEFDRGQAASGRQRLVSINKDDTRSEDGDNGAT